jgi:translation initiation factor 2 subunit 2
MDELYAIDFTLKRVYNKLENDKTNVKKFSCERPQVVLENRKTSIINFSKLCDIFKREKIEVKSFIDTELQVSSSLRGENDSILMINGIYRQKDVERVINKYIEKYVVCPILKCGSGDTNIVKKNRLTFLKCNTCKAEKVIS